MWNAQQKRAAQQAEYVPDNDDVQTEVALSEVPSTIVRLADGFGEGLKVKESSSSDMDSFNACLSTGNFGEAAKIAASSPRVSA